MKNIEIRKIGLVCGVLACILGINTAANATTMCMTNDTTAIILDPSVSGIMEGSSSDPMLNTWQTKFPDYTVYGISTCNSTSGNQNVAYSGNNNDFNQGTSGINCWCRMMLPVRSAWIYKYEFGSGSDCGSQCAEYCNSYTRNAQGFREAFYTTAGN